MNNTVTGNITTKELHLAPDILPINQYTMVCIPSASFAKNIIKLEKALKTAFKAVPASTSFTEFAFPPILDKTKTKTLAIKAPIKADVPIAFSPNNTPKPSIIAVVAPKDAPEDTPRMYGSAKGFCTIA